jgi:hypothetical protein
VRGIARKRIDAEKKKGNLKFEISEKDKIWRRGA